MAQSAFNVLLELVKAIGPAEQRRLRDWLNIWLKDPAARTTTDEVDLRMLEEGLLRSVPQPLSEADLARVRNYQPVPCTGKPISETIIEERG